LKEKAIFHKFLKKSNIFQKKFDNLTFSLSTKYMKGGF